MKMKPWIITGVSLLCAGAVCCGAAVHAGALDQKRYMKMLDLTDYTDTPDGAFSSVLMDIESADVTVQNGSALSVAAKNVPEDSYSVTVENDTLHIQLSSNNEPWYSFTPFRIPPVFRSTGEDHSDPAGCGIPGSGCGKQFRRLHRFRHQRQHPVPGSGLRRLLGTECDGGESDCRQ